MYSTCQRCAGKQSNYWTVNQAEFHIGSIQHWKVQLCAECTKHVEQALLGALRPSVDSPEGER